MLWSLLTNRYSLSILVGAVSSFGLMYAQPSFMYDEETKVLRSAAFSPEIVGLCIAVFVFLLYPQIKSTGSAPAAAPSVERDFSVPASASAPVPPVAAPPAPPAAPAAPRYEKILSRKQWSAR